VLATLPRPLRLLLLWAGLVAVYAAGLLLPAAPGEDLSSTEAHRLLAAHSLVTDRDIDLLDEYIAQPWRDWGGVVGLQDGRLTSNVAVQRDARGREGPPLAPGGYIEPTGLGLGAVLAPAYWAGRTTGIGAPLAVQLFCAGLLAAAFVLALGLARRIVPDPWATRGVLAIAVCPPVVIGATQIGPAAPTALLLTGAVSSALAVRDHPRTAAALACATLCALVPWIWLPLAPAALLVAAALARWMRRRRRGLMGYLALEVLLLSAFILVTVYDRVYGGPTPWAPQVGWSLPTFFDGAGDVVARIVTSPLGVLLDRDFGLLRWAPVLALVGVAVWRLVHWRRSRLFRVFADEIHVEVSVLFLLLVFVAAVVPYAILSPWPATNWLGGAGAIAALPVVAAVVGWAWQRVPRTGAALATVTVIGTAWMLGAGLLDDGAATDPPRGPLPWAGAERVLPEFRR
jgi:hypothetical protein